MNNFPKDLVPLGKVIKPHGIKGELKVFLYNNESSIFKEGLKLWFKSNLNKYDFYRLKSIRGSIDKKIIKLDKVFYIDTVQPLVKKEIFVSRLDFTPLNNKNGYYLNDLIGLNVLDESDNAYGVIIDIISTSANDIIVIKHNNKEFMVPVVDEFIKLFDFENRVIKINNVNIFSDL